MSKWRFNEDRKACFTINTLNLPVPWEYIFENGKMLLKVDQFGPVYAQAYPPSDIMLFRRDSTQKYSSWLVWLKSPAFSGGAFTNFFRPNQTGGTPEKEPENICITYSPESANYYFEHEGLAVTTELLCAYDEPTVLMKLQIKNLRNETIPVSLVPALLPYANPAVLAPWDRPEWYLKTGFGQDTGFAFWTQLMNMNCEKDKRRTVALLSDIEDLASVEISCERFAGQGDFCNPGAIHMNSLGRSPAAGGQWGVYNSENTLYGYPPVYAMQYDKMVRPGETKSLTLVLYMAERGSVSETPDTFEMKGKLRFFDAGVYEEEKAKIRDRYDRFLGIRSFESPDKALNRYVNEWLPLQMHWVASLDRGWPSGMRGSRDSANDFTAMVPLDCLQSRDIIKTLFSCQRSDGWFPRQYSANGRKGKHDLRGHADAGAWVVELLYEYLCHTKDWHVLAERLPWLDEDTEDTVLCHALKTIEYYIRDENLGEHGLCKLREGDWLDSVNRAGLLGRGESVMLTNQVIIALTYMIEITNGLFTGMAGQYGQSLCKLVWFEDLIGLYTQKIQEMRGDLRKHAYNNCGFFSSVFNDEGKWLFSDCDPDGRLRIYGPANWYSISSGAAVPDLVDPVLRTLDFLKCDMGYRLFWPPMGDIPMDGIGRSASGDQTAGLWENGNVYNQGSHGFLGRALAVAGRGDLLYETLLYLLPYDQEKHPTENTLTPPYAVVNCWQQIPGFIHRGGLCFLTGSIAMGLRMVYDWIAGIKPMFDGLAVDPCLPSHHKYLKATAVYLDKALKINIDNSAGKQTGPGAVTLNGNPVECFRKDPFSGRMMHFIKDSMFIDGENSIDIVM